MLELRPAVKSRYIRAVKQFYLEERIYRKIVQLKD